MSESKKEDLEKLKTFLSDNGIELSFTTDEENYIDYDVDRIVISSQQSRNHVIYTILHELGHYFLDTRFQETNKTVTVIEEVLAWDRGYDIGQTLRINIDDDEWSELMQKCIGEYIEQ